MKKELLNANPLHQFFYQKYQWNQLELELHKQLNCQDSMLIEQDMFVFS